MIDNTKRATMQIDRIASFNSLMDGRSADVQIFPDRVEWSVSAGILERATSTATVPVDRIRSVATAPAGPGRTCVTIETIGEEVAFHLPTSQGNAAREIIGQLIIGAHSSEPQYSDNGCVGLIDPSSR